MKNLRRTKPVNRKFIYSFCTALFLLAFSLSAKAQLGTGDGTSFLSPYVLTDPLTVGYNRYEGQCTSCYPHYNNYGNPYTSGNDRWIKITVAQSGYLKLIGGTSTFDSVFHLLDSTGTPLVTADDGTGSSDNVGHSNLQPLINYPVSPGTYYLVVDGSTKYTSSPGTTWTSASGTVAVHIQLN